MVSGRTRHISNQYLIHLTHLLSNLVMIIWVLVTLRIPLSNTCLCKVKVLQRTATNLRQQSLHLNHRLGVCSFPHQTMHTALEACPPEARQHCSDSPRHGQPCLLRATRLATKDPSSTSTLYHSICLALKWLHRTLALTLVSVSHEAVFVVSLYKLQHAHTSS